LGGVDWHSGPPTVERDRRLCMQLPFPKFWPVGELSSKKYKIWRWKFPTLGNLGANLIFSAHNLLVERDVKLYSLTSAPTF